MNNTINQVCVGWVGNEIGKEIFVVVDSSPITFHSCNEAERLVVEGKCLQSVLSIVFLNEKLDSPELRSWLQSEAARRFSKSR